MAGGDGDRGGALEHEGAMEDRFEASGRRAHRDVAPHGGGGSVDRWSPSVKEWSRRILVLTQSLRGSRLDQTDAESAGRW
jgi:hypothetical protein